MLFGICFAAQVELQAKSAPAQRHLGADWLLVHNGPETSANVSLLAPGCAYLARVRAEGEAGIGPWSAVAEVCRWLLLHVAARLMRRVHRARGCPGCPGDDRRAGVECHGRQRFVTAWHWLGKLSSLPYFKAVRVCRRRHERICDV